MEGYTPFNYDAQRAKLVAGYKSELVQFKSIAQWPKLTFVDAVHPAVQQMQEAKTITDTLPTIDPWYSRRG